jgi:leader peptidase (prepilin peptidase)/N-methyltransferase
VVRPASRCPRCGTPIKSRHNIPVLGWLILRGRCATCSAPISVRYPLIELGTGLLFAAFAWLLTH